MIEKKKSVIRIARVSLAIVSILLMTVLFASGAGHGTFSFLAKIQFIPSLLAFNAAVLIGLLVLTLLFGRIYCSVICPLGITQDLVNWITKKAGGKKKAIRFGWSKPHNILRYTILAVYILAVIFGIGSFIALLDPYAIFGRMMTDTVRSVVNLAGGNYIALNALALSVTIVTVAAVIIMAVRGGRTYCNSICPVGSFLGLISRMSLFKIRIDESKCSGCGLCGKKCRASCIDTKNHIIDYSRCVNCFDCLDNCNQKALVYSAKRTDRNMANETEDQSRRKFLSALAMIGLAGSKVWAQDKVEKVESVIEGKERTKHTAVSPFGSISHKHLNSKCSACHLCIDKCPQKVLRPALNEYGMDGIMQPVMDYTSGYCDYDCTLCGQVCPAGAIKPLTLDEKQSTHIGIAVFTLDECIINKGALTCNKCQQVCPSDAIQLIPDYNQPLTPEEIETVDAIPVEKRPHIHFKIYPQIESELCIGCGTCQYYCPGKAIVIEGFESHR